MRNHVFCLRTLEVSCCYEWFFATTAGYGKLHGLQVLSNFLSLWQLLPAETDCHQEALVAGLTSPAIVRLVCRVLEAGASRSRLR